MKPAGLVLTFVSVTTAMVFFRAPTMMSAVDLVKGIIGLNGIALPQALFDRLRPLTSTFHGVIGVIADPGASQDFAKTAIWIGGLMLIALACPNTLQILARYQPALGVSRSQPSSCLGEPLNGAPRCRERLRCRPSQRSRPSP